jgi:hypothetical protein
MVRHAPENEPATFRLSSNTTKNKEIKARTPKIAQGVADALINATIATREYDREHYRANRVWVVSYCDPHDSIHPGVWGVYCTPEYAQTEAAACEAAGWINVLISERGLDYPGTKDWWHL